MSGVLLLTSLLYANSMFNGITNWDDPEYFLHDEYIKNFSIESIVHFFSTPYVYMYQPLTLTVYSLEYFLFGLNPATFHLASLLFHLLNILLVYVLIFRLTAKTGIAFITSILFAIHPLNVESVAWISATSNLLTTVFSLLAINSYLFYVKSGKSKWIILSFFVFTVAILFKVSAIVLPILLLLIYYFTNGKIEKKQLIETIPFFLVSLIFGSLALYISGSGSVEYSIRPEYSIVENMLLVFYSLDFYIVKFLWPTGLSAFYYPLDPNSLPTALYLSPLPIFCFIFLLYKVRNLEKRMVLGGCWFIVFISISLLTPSRETLIADRYVYSASIGIALMFASFGQYLFSRLNRKKVKFSLLFVFSCYIGILSFQTFHRVGIWQSGYTLFTNVIEKFPQEALAYNYRGAALLESSEHQKSIADFNTAIKIDPNNFDTYNNRGLAKIALNNLEGAIQDFSKAIKLNPDLADLYKNRATTYIHLNDFEKAVADIHSSIALDDQDAKSYYSLAFCQERLSNPSEAILNYSQAIQMDPGYYSAYVNRANLKIQRNDFRGAISDCTKAISLNPDVAQAYNYRGISQGSLGNYEQAILDFSMAILNDQNYGEAYFNRGLAKSATNTVESACKDWEVALSLGYKKAQKLIDSNCATKK